MAEDSGFEERWAEIKQIWRSKENQWLYALVGFVAGILLSPFLVNTNSVLADLFPEAIGILFTIVVIERFINARDEFRNARQNIFNNFDSLAEIFRGLFPYPSQRDLNGIGSWLEWIKSQRINRYKHLFPNERELSDKCIEIAILTQESVKRYLTQNQQVEHKQAALKLLASELKAARNEVRTILNTFFYKYSHDALQEPISLKSTIPLFQSILGFNHDHLSNTELKVIEELISQIEHKELFSYDDILNINLKLRDIGDSIQYYDCEWYLILERTVSGINQHPGYTADISLDNWHQIEVSIDKDSDRFPSSVIDVAHKYRAAVVDLNLVNSQLQTMVFDYFGQLELLTRELDERK